MNHLLPIYQIQRLDRQTHLFVETKKYFQYNIQRV